MIHHSDAGFQYTAIRLTEHLALEGIAASKRVTIACVHECGHRGHHRDKVLASIVVLPQRAQLRLSPLLGVQDRSSDTARSELTEVEVAVEPLVCALLFHRGVIIDD